MQSYDREGKLVIHSVWNTLAQKYDVKHVSFYATTEDAYLDAENYVEQYEGNCAYVVEARKFKQTLSTSYDMD